MTTLDYTTPDTALLDLDWLIDQAALFITTNAVDSELEARTFPHHPDVWNNTKIRAEVKHYLAHLSVEEIYDPYLDQMGKLELVCRKEEVSRKLNRRIAGLAFLQGRKAA